VTIANYDKSHISVFEALAPTAKNMKVAAIAVPLLGAFVIAQQAKLMTPGMPRTIPHVHDSL
jgi:hypothetical protein